MAKFLKIGFFFLIGILLIWWSLHQIPPQEWDKFTKALAKSKFWLIIPIFFILGLSHFMRALRWRLIMEPLGYKPSIMNTFLAVLIGYLANLAMMRMPDGQPWRWSPTRDAPACPSSSICSRWR